MVQPAQTYRTLNQIVGPNGETHAASATSNVWVGRPGVFARPTEGNKIEALLSGKQYFDALIKACDAALSEICILGWQVNWDAQLAPGQRLWDLLYRAANRRVKIYVMPWDDFNPVQTYDDQTALALDDINRRLGLSGNARCVHVTASSSWAPKNKSYFSHHQKLVVVDRNVAFVGGIDLAYGRYCDDTFNLRADADGRQVLNRYNGCVAWVGQISEKDCTLVNPDEMSGAGAYFRNPLSGASRSSLDIHSDRIATGGWQVPYAEPGGWNTINNSVGTGRRTEVNTPDFAILDATRQPRLPWQDVHSRIEGPAVSDLLRNFVLRWNASGGKSLDLPAAPSSYPKAGNVNIQVLRSAPAGHVQAEYEKRSSKSGVAAPQGAEDDIYNAMIQLIEKSNRFIYIENQFFVSASGAQIPARGSALSAAANFINTRHGGQTSGQKIASTMDADTRWRPRLGVKAIDDDKAFDPPRNRICGALIARIQRAILDVKQPKFHVYITVPVHSEGLLDKASIAVQVYWTQQTLSFGSRSLLNGIRRALKAKELRDKGDPAYMRVVNDDGNTEFESISVDACWDWVTLLNLRNWAKLGDRYVTEQVYVHSKLMVVDDLYALLGSANVNDRSLLGDRDSELAVLVMDGDSFKADVNGTGSQRPVRRFAHELRKNIWKKLFGISGNVRPASALMQAIDQPGKPDSWKSIQRQARANAAAYEAVFEVVPRNESIFAEAGAASILPGFRPATAQLERAMPFEDRYWNTPHFKTEHVAKLESVRGFVCALPENWGRGEHNQFAYPSTLVVDAGSNPTLRRKDDSIASAASAKPTVDQSVPS